jgi:hypothetical protein
MTQAIANKQVEKSSQVWAQLAKEHQRGIIRLMARLVVKKLVEQLEMVGEEGGEGA